MRGKVFINHHLKYEIFLYMGYSLYERSTMWVLFIPWISYYYNSDSATMASLFYFFVTEYCMKIMIIKDLIYFR